MFKEAVPFGICKLGMGRNRMWTRHTTWTYNLQRLQIQTILFIMKTGFRCIPTTSANNEVAAMSNAKPDIIKLNCSSRLFTRSPRILASSPAREPLKRARPGKSVDRWDRESSWKFWFASLTCLRFSLNKRKGRVKEQRFCWCLVRPNIIPGLLDCRQQNGV